MVSNQGYAVGSNTDGRVIAGAYRKVAIALLLIAGIVSALIPLAINKINSGRIVDARAAEVTLQRQAIDNYNTHADRIQNIIDMSAISTRDALQADELDVLLQEAMATMAAFNAVLDIAVSASYVSDEMTAFLYELQAQSDALNVDSGKQARASYNEDHWITQKILFVTLTLGFHFSPSTCNVIEAMVIAGVAIAGVIAYFSSGLLSFISGGVAVILAAYAAILHIGAIHKGCDWISAFPGLIVPTL